MHRSGVHASFEFTYPPYMVYRFDSIDITSLWMSKRLCRTFLGIFDTIQYLSLLTSTLPLPIINLRFTPFNSMISINRYKDHFSQNARIVTIRSLESKSIVTYPDLLHALDISPLMTFCRIALNPDQIRLIGFNPGSDEKHPTDNHPSSKTAIKQTISSLRVMGMARE